MKTPKSFDVRQIVLLALLTAIVAVLQSVAAVLPIFPFTLTLVLVPIVIGSALINAYAGCWLGLVFGLTVLLTGNANIFLAFDPLATILVVLLKGALAGLTSGAVYKLLERKSKTAAVIVAALICPIVNTGIFVLGCYLFFLPVVMSFGEVFGHESAAAIIFLGFVGINFPLEVAVNIVFSPTIVRLVQFYNSRSSLVRTSSKAR